MNETVKVIVSGALGAAKSHTGYYTIISNSRKKEITNSYFEHVLKNSISYNVDYML